MELQDKLKEIEGRIKENEKQFEGLERKEVLEETEEEVHWLSGKGNKLNEEMWYYIRGSKSAKYFEEADYGLREYRNRMQMHFDDKYDEIAKTKSQLYREQDDLREVQREVREKIKSEED